MNEQFKDVGNQPKQVGETALVSLNQVQTFLCHRLSFTS